MIPPSQISYLTNLNFVVVAPNYRLCPQVSVQDGAFADTASAIAWCRAKLPSLLKSSHKISVDSTKVVAMGHSAGGTLALWLAAQPSPPHAVASFYPSLYVSDINSSAHKPYDGFGPMDDFNPTPENLSAVFHPEDNLQLSTFPLAFPGQPRQLRHEWFLTQLKNGTLWPAIQPDQNYAAIDPCTLFADRASTWPPTFFVQGDKDDVPGSGIALAERAAKELEQAGARLVKVQKVEGAPHMFDMAPTAAVGGEGFGQAVKSALDFLRDHV